MTTSFTRTGLSAIVHPASSSRLVNPRTPCPLFKGQQQEGPAGDQAQGSQGSQEETGKKVGGRKTYQEMDSGMVTPAKKLHRYPVNGQRRSLREIANELASAGFKTSTGKPYAAAAVAKIIAS